jgi:prepilin-type N-terminal cleavage/methylation domain-containing protein
MFIPPAQKHDSSTASPSNHRSAFTLIELLVVISIVSLLISILLPALRQARESARAIQCLASLRQCGFGVLSYAEDFKLWMMCHDAQAQLPGTAVKTPLRYERYWSIALKRNGYLSSNNVQKFEKDAGWSAPGRDYYWTANYKSYRDVTICPEAPTDAKYMRAEYMDYGVRKGPYATNEEFSNGYKTIRLTTINTRMPYLMDAANKTAPGSGAQTVTSSTQFNGYSASGASPQDTFAVIARRHLDGSNAWMPDGSGKRIGKDEMLNLDDTLPYSWYSEEY